MNTSSIIEMLPECIVTRSKGRRLYGPGFYIASIAYYQWLVPGKPVQSLLLKCGVWAQLKLPGSLRNWKMASTNWRFLRRPYTQELPEGAALPASEEIVQALQACCLPTRLYFGRPDPHDCMGLRGRDLVLRCERGKWNDEAAEWWTITDEWQRLAQMS